MKTIAVLQARTQSTRFPNKVLIPLFAGKCSIEIIVEKLKRIKAIDQIVVATSINSEDSRIVDFCKAKGYECFQGSEEDVLDRVVRTIRNYENRENIKNGEIVDDMKYDICVELTGDCPLFDPKIVESALALFDTIEDLDYVSNVVTRSWFDGADVQVYKADILKNIASKVDDSLIPEHVGWNILHLCDNKRIVNFPAPKKYFAPNLRLTLDYPEDGKVIAEVMQMAGSENVGIADIYAIIEANPWLSQINKDLISKTPGVM